MMSLLAIACRCNAQTQIHLPDVDPSFTIRVEADEIAKETRGNYDVLAFRGHCKLTQGPLSAAADDLVLWIERSLPDEPDRPGKIIAMLSGQARLDWGEQKLLRDERWMGRLFSLYPVRFEAKREVRRFDIPQLDWKNEPSASIGLNQVQLVQFTAPSASVGPQGPSSTAITNITAQPLPPLLPTGPAGGGLQVAPSNSIPATPGAVQWDTRGGLAEGNLIPNVGLVIPEGGAAPYPAVSPSSRSIDSPPPFPEQTQVVQQPPVLNPLAAKRVIFSQRNAQSTIDYKPDPMTGGNVAELRGGFRLVVDGIKLHAADGSVTDVGTVSLEADNAIVWLNNAGRSLMDGLTSSPDRPIELYLDQNIVFKQGNRVIYADRMYYNISSEYGMVLGAEMLTPVPQYQGLLRLKADVLQQMDRRNFRAFGAALTSSRLGVPRYWLQSGEVEFQDKRNDENLSIYTPTDYNRPTDLAATARTNFLYLGGLPVLFWPTLKTNLAEPSFYLTSTKFSNDKIFGTQAYLDWDLYQLLGIRGPEGTKAKLSTNYLSKRGFSLGGRFDYNQPATWFFGAPGTGFTDAWFIDDRGKDFLGLDRTNLTPEKRLRGRAISRHRLFLSPNFELIGESGFTTDRNFMEQYFENEWDQDKDLTTALRLRRYNGNRMLDIFAQPRVNSFFTETQSLPRINHYWLGQDLFGSRLTWNAATNVGYVHQRVASTPLDPVDAAKFFPRPWERDREGLKTNSRHEFSLPLNLGVWKTVPYVLGEVGFWNKDLNNEEVTRTAGQVGLRTSLPFWSVNRNVESRLFDLRELAHKVTLYSDFFLADTNKDYERFPLYDPLDDNAQEHFRRRFVIDTFGGTIPGRFDERSYAVRSGIQRWVTAGSSEIFDNTQQVRLGINQRWQTKRGLPGRERIEDVVSLDFNGTFFPRRDKDNFGEDFGLLNYRFRYQIGDRWTLLSDGYADLFDRGLRTISLGANMSRPGVGDAYLGLLSIEGPVSAAILNGNLNYRLTEKWILSGGAAFDFGRTGTIGQSLSLVRQGETALVSVGMNVDSGRDNVSFSFNIEPRFLPSRRLGQLGGELISPAGLFGVE